MAKEKNNTPAPQFARRKVSADYIDVKETKTFVGRILGALTGEWTDKKSGEVKALTRLMFDAFDLETGKLSGERTIVLMDAGLKKALEDGMVRVGEVVELNHLGKDDIGGGRTVNKYDVFVLDVPNLAKVESQGRLISDLLIAQPGIPTESEEGRHLRSASA